MRFSLTVLVFAALNLAACKPAARPPAPDATAADVVPLASASAAPQQVLTCDYPVNGNKDTAASVLARFGKDAKRADLPGVEGMGAKGIVLWGDDPARRIELTIDDESSNERIFELGLHEPASRWQVSGLSMGSPLEKVVEANGGAFEFWGFGWDYAGYVSDFKGGNLDRLEGGCDLTLRLGYKSDGAPIDEGLMGDTAVQSNEPKLGKLKLTVDDLGLNWR